MAINKLCVIGAGTMGAGIAAQAANAGVPVLLLDIVRDANDRNSVAAGAIERLKKAEPAAFMSKAAARLVEAGNIDDDLGRVAECDWVIEAIVEKIELKHALYEKLEGVRRPGTAISSNTSTIPLDRLIEGRSEAFARDFLITHFFNPPRYMRLLEVVAGPKSDPALVAAVSDFADRAMGKSVVHAKDTPGFLANRVGTYWLQAAINAAFDLGVSVEDADAIGGRPMGVPKTGIFGLVDLVGIDLMPYLKASLTSTLPANDPYQAIAHDHPLILKMIADGYTGRKGKGGFYRINKEAGKVKEAINLNTGEYTKAAKPVSIPSAAQKDLRALIAAPGVVGAYAWAVLGPSLAYAAGLIGEASDDILSIDVAMKLGYNWKYGPFELIDRIGGADFVARLQAEGREVPAILTLAAGRPFYRVEEGQRQYLGADGEYHAIARPEGVLLLEDIKAASKPILKSASAALWDIGDGVVALEFTGKMNALDGEVMKLIEKAIPLVTEQYKALVVYNEGSNFSAGANLGLAIFAINIAAWGEVEKLVAGGQKAYKALKYAPFPVVAAPFGMALGGGCEICLNADAVQAHAETYIGLVECGVGLIPGWGGCGELMVRAAESPKAPKGPMPPVAKAFETISTATVAKSAANAKEIGYLRPSDGITMNRDRLLADAKARALAMVEGYTPPAPPIFRLPGASGKTALELAVKGFRARGLATPYDEVVADKLATVLTGGDADVVDTVTEEQLLALELREFMTLVRDSRTQARVEHMLTTGKPLRN
ncbi:3-hydroxyacyl-CoA dehydrogenase/enoyl-CoA hydratase family protein [Novosphingobium sediminicola]|uniref:3-hydroxyacyl-CoA dehydrogenase n=1 Tax=Novosphingobium sediminicola TaxID=563162 RepID=A0A7W6CF13_9SPHN|nr:3-hydroxyacyl-CoA dehydrogenase/enoyl-CoA hydratase family protein [Novosphingobium sediminicola]MBB3955338.1 3-hydroxyacyl-CoA dehydrogenase [Novosphingobium sediminicola]